MYEIGTVLVPKMVGGFFHALGDGVSVLNTDQQWMVTDNTGLYTLINIANGEKLTSSLGDISLFENPGILIVQNKNQVLEASEFKAKTYLEKSNSVIKNSQLITKNLAYAKKFLKGRCGYGYIDANVNGKWVTLFIYTGSQNFIRVKHGSDASGNYIKYR